MHLRVPASEVGVENTEAPFEASSRFWDAHAGRDPLRAILSDPNKRQGEWDVRKFFLTGVGEISSLIYTLRTQGVDAPRGRALDFGCGVGRLSQSLGSHV